MGNKVFERCILRKKKKIIEKLERFYNKCWGQAMSLAPLS